MSDGRASRQPHEHVRPGRRRQSSSKYVCLPSLHFAPKKDPHKNYAVNALNDVQIVQHEDRLAESRRRSSSSPSRLPTCPALSCPASTAKLECHSASSHACLSLSSLVTESDSDDVDFSSDAVLPARIVPRVVDDPRLAARIVR